MKIVFNGKIIEAKEGDGLKEILQNAGVNFPCGGTGRCGKCRITCPDLAPTKLDERFLTEEQIESGIRLACDKRLERDLTVRYDGETVSVRTRDLDACRIACSIGYDRIEIGIMDDTIAEKVVIDDIQISEIRKISLFLGTGRTQVQVRAPPVLDFDDMDNSLSFLTGIT